MRVARISVAVVLVVAAALLAASARAAVPAVRQRVATIPRFQRTLLDDINMFRVAHGRRPVRLSAALTASAAQHSREMGADGYFAHASAGGEAFWQRIRTYYQSRAWAVWSVGENLLWSAPTIGAARALRMWERSPEHLANLLSPRWREIGISAVRVVAAPGVFHGRSVTIVTTDFGVRR